MRKLVHFKNDYLETKENLQDEGDVFAKIFIDGYSADEDDEGEVVATVSITDRGDIVIDWHNNGYRMNEVVRKLIQQSIVQLYQVYFDTSNISSKVYLARKEDGGWFYGKHTKGYEFEAKIEDEESIEALNNGRVVILNIYRDDSETLMLYNKKWNVKPMDKEIEQIFKDVLYLLENVLENKNIV